MNSEPVSSRIRNKTTRKSRKVVRLQIKPLAKKARGSTKSNTRVLTQVRRQSARFSSSKLVETFGLGDERTSTNISDKVTTQFINTHIIVNKPVVVSLPVSPQRHAFLVFVSSKYKKIMISDWYPRRDDGILGYQDSEKWKTYNTFMELLKEKYPTYPLDFFPVDKKLQKEAKAHHKKNKNSLGCSYYIYEWIKQHAEELT